MSKTKTQFQIYRIFTDDLKYNRYHSTSRGMKGVEEVAKKNSLNGWSFEVTNFVCKDMSSAMKKCNELNSTEEVTIIERPAAEVMKGIMKEHRQKSDIPLTMAEIDNFIARLEHGLNYYKNMKKELEGGNKNGN